MRLILVRHGESSEGNDPPLTEKGNKQARLVARSLSLKPDKIYVSSATRAKQTYEHYARIHNPHCEIVITDLAKEIYRAIVGGPEKLCTDPQREPDDLTRISSFLEELRSQEGNILVFAHGNVIRFVISRLAGIADENLWENMRIDCASISILERVDTGFSVHIVNEVSHFSDRSETGSTLSTPTQDD